MTNIRSMMEETYPRDIIAGRSITSPFENPHLRYLQHYILSNDEGLKSLRDISTDLYRFVMGQNKTNYQHRDSFACLASDFPYAMLSEGVRGEQFQDNGNLAKHHPGAVAPSELHFYTHLADLIHHHMAFRSDLAPVFFTTNAQSGNINDIIRGGEFGKIAIGNLRGKSNLPNPSTSIKEAISLPDFPTESTAWITSPRFVSIPTQNQDSFSEFLTDGKVQTIYRAMDIVRDTTTGKNMHFTDLPEVRELHYRAAMHPNLYPFHMFLPFEQRNANSTGLFKLSSWGTITDFSEIKKSLLANQQWRDQNRLDLSFAKDRYTEDDSKLSPLRFGFNYILPEHYFWVTDHKTQLKNLPNNNESENLTPKKFLPYRPIGKNIESGLSRFHNESADEHISRMYELVKTLRDKFSSGEYLRHPDFWTGHTFASNDNISADNPDIAGVLKPSLKDEVAGMYSRIGSSTPFAYEARHYIEDF